MRYCDLESLQDPALAPEGLEEASARQAKKVRGQRVGGWAGGGCCPLSRCAVCRGESVSRPGYAALTGQCRQDSCALVMAAPFSWPLQRSRFAAVCCGKAPAEDEEEAVVAVAPGKAAEPGPCGTAAAAAAAVAAAEAAERGEGAAAPAEGDVLPPKRSGAGEVLDAAAVAAKAAAEAVVDVGKGAVEAVADFGTGVAGATLGGSGQAGQAGQYGGDEG